MKYPDPSVIAKKCVKRAMAAETEYEQGVRNPDKDWANETADAEPRYNDETTKAMKRGAFGKGVKDAGTQKQQDATIVKGVEQRRWHDGISIAEDAIATAQGPIAAKMRATTLPPRGPKGSPAQVKRFEKVRDAMIEVGQKS